MANKSKTALSGVSCCFSSSWRAVAGLPGQPAATEQQLRRMACFNCLACLFTSGSHYDLERRRGRVFRVIFFFFEKNSREPLSFCDEWKWKMSSNYSETLVHAEGALWAPDVWGAVGKVNTKVWNTRCTSDRKGLKQRWAEKFKINSARVAWIIYGRYRIFTALFSWALNVFMCQALRVGSGDETSRLN